MSKRADKVIRQARDAFDREVEGWMPQPKALKVGDRVMLTGMHPHAGKPGTVVRFEPLVSQVALPANLGQMDVGRRTVVKLDSGREVFVTQVDEWRPA